MMGLQRGILRSIGAALATIGFAFFTPWPAYALAPAILAPFSVMLLVGLGITSALFPQGSSKRTTVQHVTILLVGVFAGSLILLPLYKGP